METSVELYPGFPLPISDYEPLLVELRTLDLGIPAVRLGHSLGSIRVLAQPSELPTVLLAPSVPGERPWRALLRAGLRTAAITPARDALASSLRAASYRKYGAFAPPGGSLSLKDAAEQLNIVRAGELQPVSHIVVVCSSADPRYPRQVQLAERIAAAVHWVEGGHMFPVTQPARTAEVIAIALS